jgi:hypothetical protein
MVPINLTQEPQRPKTYKSKNYYGVARKKNKSKDTITAAKKEAWKWFSKFIRYRDALDTTGQLGYVRCCTCDILLPINKSQAGHFLPGRIDVVLFDEKGVHAQCYRCNVMLTGAWPSYYRFMQDRYGQSEIESMITGWQHNNIKYTIEELKALELLYKSEVERYERGESSKDSDVDVG